MPVQSKIPCIIRILEASQKVIGTTEVVCFTATLLAHSLTEPQVQYIVQVDIDNNGDNIELCGVALSVALVSPSSMIPLFSIRMISLTTRRFNLESAVALAELHV